MNRNFTGVFTPVITPFKSDLSVDAERAVSFCKWLVSQGSGLAVFGTNSEANSLSLAERHSLLDKLIDSGIDPARLVPGTGACALPEAIELTRHAVERGCAGVLMLPPFYYKGVSDAGLFDYYARVIEAVGADRLRVLLYHIPQVSGVPISFDLIAKLIDRYPNTVVGIKDSSGDWANTEGMLRHFPGFAIFPASEALLMKAMPLGAAGCISATANINPGPIAELIRRWNEPSVAPLAKKVEAVRLTMQKFNMIPALKQVVAHYSGEPAWRNVRPPFLPLEAEPSKAIIDALGALDFSMPGLRS